jgi:hypothetical protein
MPLVTLGKKVKILYDVLTVGLLILNKVTLYRLTRPNIPAEAMARLACNSEQSTYFYSG